MTQTPSDTARLTQATPIESDQATRRRRAWNDAPLRRKLALMICLGAAGGALVGMTQAHLAQRVWPLVLGMSLVVAPLLWLGHVWIILPFDRLLAHLRAVTQRRRLRSIQDLDLTRADELGQLARYAHEITSTALRDNNEARRLRRTLDDRVAHATRIATRKLRDIAMRDSLTSLGNRRFLDEQFEPLVHSVFLSHGDLICILIDMDNFKQVNDTLGHAAGDELLVFLASLIRGSARSEDYTARLGGDEFLVLMPGATVERARLYADHLLALFRQRTRMSLPRELKTDLSIGIASLQRDHATTSAELLRAADANLYLAKGQGKGCIVGGE